MIIVTIKYKIPITINGNCYHKILIYILINDHCYNKCLKIDILLFSNQNIKKIFIAFLILLFIDYNISRRWKCFKNLSTSGFCISSGLQSKRKRKHKEILESSLRAEKLWNMKVTGKPIDKPGTLFDALERKLKVLEINWRIVTKQTTVRSRLHRILRKVLET